MKKYEDSLKELEEIISQIEKGEISIDNISEQIKRANILIKECRDKLIGVEKDIEDLTKEEKIII